MWKIEIITIFPQIHWISVMFCGNQLSPLKNNKFSYRPCVYSCCCFIFQVVIKYVLITKDEKYYICDFFAKYNCVFFEGFWNHIIMGFLKFMSPKPHFPQIPQPLQSWVFYVLVYLLYFSVSEKNNTSQKLVCRFTIAYIKIK